ncbi:MAG: hypothetical protein CM15mV25_1280 [uncultured marine virus]|nr:MAG: hypothetical protein CM15mV25_1280 [uncultured marine virus]
MFICFQTSLLVVLTLNALMKDVRKGMRLGSMEYSNTNMLTMEQFDSTTNKRHVFKRYDI